MPDDGLFASHKPGPSAATVFSRAARVSLIGLLAPGAVTVLAAAMGHPVAGPVRVALDSLSVLAFTASGARVAHVLGGGRRGTVFVMIGFTLAGLCVSPAYDSLRGLTGRESVAVVAGIVVPAFALGFAAAAAVAAVAQRAASRTVVRLAMRGALAGSAGGAIALVPFLMAAARVAIAVPYVAEFLTAGSFLGCVIVPYRMVGAAFDTIDGSGAWR